MEPISLSVAYSALWLSFIQSWQNPVFWQMSSAFLSIFILIVILNAIPYKVIFDRCNVISSLYLTLPILGLVNVFVLLLIADTLINFTDSKYQLITPIIIWVLVFQYVCIWFWARPRQVRQKLNNSVSGTWWRTCIATFIALYFVISALYFDPKTSIFFPPGIELNHDSMNLHSAVLHVQRNVFISPDNPAGHLGGLSLFNYPRGSIMYIVFFSTILNIPAYQVFSLLTLVAYLFTVFIIGSIIHKYNHHLNILIKLMLIASIINYIGMSFVNTGVMASTLMTPIGIFTISLILSYVRERFSTIYILLLSLTLVAGVYIYSYILLLMYILVIILYAIINHRQLKTSNIIPFIIPILFSLANPLNLTNVQNIAVQHFTSSNKETNLFLGMHGNLSGYISLFKFSSLWFSNPIYIIGGLHTGNGLLIFTIGLALIIFIRQAKVTKEPILPKWIKFFWFPYCVLLVLALINRSPYQQSKLLQLAAPLVPITFYYFLRRYNANTSLFKLYHHPFLQKQIVTFLISFLFITIILSGLYASSYIGRPITKSYLELTKLESKVCDQTHQSITVIGRDEWASNALFNCQNIHFYFDRLTNRKGIVAFNQHNERSFLSSSCVPDSLELVDYPQFKDDYLLVDRCIRYYPQNYLLESEGTIYRYFKLMTPPAQTL